MKKSLFVIAVMAVVLACTVAFAGVDEPLLRIGGSIKAGTVPVVTMNELSNNAAPDFYVVGNINTANTTGYVTGEIRIDPKHWASKPVAEGKLPTEKNGLINPGKPICVEASNFDFDGSRTDGKTVSFYAYNGIDYLRVMDVNGKTVGTVREKDNPEGKPLNVKLPGKTQRYYLEFCYPQARGARYFYLLVEVVQAKQEPQFGQGNSTLSHPWSKKSPEELMKLTEEIENYEKQHGQAQGYDAFRVIIDNTNKALGYKAFDIKELMGNAPQQQKEKTKAAPAKKSTKTKRTKKSK